jgi:hypothetical protein
MPTAVEYAVMTHWHAQNGAGGGPPAQDQAAVLQLNVPPSTPSGEWLLTAPLAALLLVVTIVAAVRRRARRSAPRESVEGGLCPDL